MIAPGVTFTVKVVVDGAPQPVVYVIYAVPAAMPVTSPVVEPMVATERLPLVHVPNSTALLSVVTSPRQIAAGPVITAGVARTVTTEFIEQRPSL